jgi:hypothetical protein
MGDSPEIRLIFSYSGFLAFARLQLAATSLHLAANSRVIRFIVLTSRNSLVLPARGAGDDRSRRAFSARLVDSDRRRCAGDRRDFLCR